MPTLKRCHIATTEAEYLAKLMQKHAGDCTVWLFIQTQNVVRGTK